MEYAQQRRPARPIQPNDANLRAIEIGKIDVFEDGLLVIELTDADHGIDDFVFSGHDFRVHRLHRFRREGKTRVA